MKNSNAEKYGTAENGNAEKYGAAENSNAENTVLLKNGNTGNTALMKSRETGISMEFTEAWFEDEVRDGFYIPALMKRCRAAELEMLDMLARFWREQGIRWHAAGETLAGAAHCRGFLPWSDRITVSMSRENLRLFEEVAGALPEGLTFISSHAGDGSETGNCPTKGSETDSCMVDGSKTVSRVTNGSAINWSEEFLARWHGFPYAAAVEILEEDTAGIGTGSEAMTPDAESDLLSRKTDAEVTTASKILPERMNAAEEGFLNFENLKVPVSADYEKIVAVDFGNSHRKSDAYSDRKPEENLREGDYPCYMAQEHAYNRETNMVSRCFYRFHMDDLRKPLKNTDEKIVDSFLGAFTEAHRQVLRTVQMPDSGDFIRHFTRAQDTAVKFGNFIEVNYPQGAIVIVPILEAYCNRLYLLGESLTAEKSAAAGEAKTGASEVNTVSDAAASVLSENNVSATGSETGEPENTDGEESEHRMHPAEFSGLQVSPADCLEACMRFASAVQAAVQHEILEKREIVFLPFKASGWKNLEPLYRYYKSRQDCRVCVVPVPYYHVTDQNTYGEKVYEGDDFPEDVEVISYETFNLYTHRPDTIVTQCPYDQYSMGIRLSADLYAGELQKFTSHLIYVPWFRTDEIDHSDRAAVAMSDYYILQPGVTMSDVVLVRSSELREFYIDRLTELCGAQTRPIWERKVQTIEGSVIL